jgi:two-component system sensor histidine kinase DesK
MDMTETAPRAPAEVGWRSSRRRGPLFAGVWLVFLVQPFVAAVQLRTLRGYAGAAVLVVFAGMYLVVVREFRAVIARERRSRRTVLVSVVAMLVLSVVSVALLGVPGLSTAPYVAVIGPIVLGRWAVAWVAAVAVVVELLYRWLAHAWADNLGLATGTIAAGMAVWGFVLVLQRGADQSRAREVEARLAVISERDRFARDLHDILGHSLTVITVKAELAGRLLDVAPDRARAEVADLEELAREALADVRRAVAGYREITLADEIDRARGALLSGGIDTQTPTELPVLPSDVDEMFAWAVREGVTNVLRHSRATHCVISVSPTRLVVSDDGRGMGARTATTAGNGLQGLLERARLAGVDLGVGPQQPRGTRLEVTVPGIARTSPPAREVVKP